MQHPGIRYTPEQEIQVKKSILFYKAYAIRQWSSTSGMELNDALEAAKEKMPAYQYRNLEVRIRDSVEFFEDIGGITVKQEATPYSKVEWWYNYFEEGVRVLQSLGMNVDWRNSTIVWALENADKTDKEIFDKEMARKLYYAAFEERDYHGIKDLVRALKNCKIPIAIIENALLNDAIFDITGEEYTSIHKGYRGKLCAEAAKILSEKLQYLQGLNKNFRLTQEVYGDTPEGLEFMTRLVARSFTREDPNTQGRAYKRLKKKAGRILKERGIHPNEALKRFEDVGEF